MDRSLLPYTSTDEATAGRGVWVSAASQIDDITAIEIKWPAPADEETTVVMKRRHRRANRGPVTHPPASSGQLRSINRSTPVSIPRQASPAPLEPLLLPDPTTEDIPSEDAPTDKVDLQPNRLDLHRPSLLAHAAPVDTLPDESVTAESPVTDELSPTDLPTEELSLTLDLDTAWLVSPPRQPARHARATNLAARAPAPVAVPARMHSTADEVFASTANRWGFIAGALFGALGAVTITGLAWTAVVLVV